MRNIILVGFMGTGKSAVGKLLAQRLQKPFVDLDERIAKEAGRSIPEIFAREGEHGFRKRESRVVKWASGLKDHVVATGGGVMLDAENVKRLKKSGRIVCLTAQPDLIMKRLEGTLHARPLLNVRHPQEHVDELLRIRTASYAQADFSVDTSSRSIEEVAEEILKKVNE